MLNVPNDLAQLFRTGLTRSISSFLLKVATAGLTYVGLIVLSRLMAPDEYGYFAFGLALATVLALVAGLGQQTAILRFWQEERAKGHPEKALIALRAGSALTVLGGLVVGVGVVLFAVGLAMLYPGTGPHLHFWATAVLVLPLALAEYNSSALRAQGSVWTALAPRDVVWRLAMPGTALFLWWLDVGLSGWGVLLISAGLLLTALALQQGVALIRGYCLAPGLAGVGEYWRERGRASRWLLLGGFISSLALNVDTLIVGALLDPESAGAYFNAFRTAGLMTLLSFAIALIIAPLIAQYFHSRDLRKAQAVLTMAMGAGFLFAFVGFIGLLLFGDIIMGLFGDEYRGATPILLVLAFGFLADAATGPSRTVMMMTGHEHRYAQIIAVATLLSVVAKLAALTAFGVLGVAVISATSRIVVNFIFARYCITKVGLNPTIFGLITHGRASAKPAKNLDERQLAE